MTTPNYPQQPGPYGPPQGGQQQPPPYAPQRGGQQAPPYPPPGGQQPPPYGQQPPPPYGQQPPPYGQQPGSPPPAYPAAPTGQPAKGGRNKVLRIVIGLVVVAIAAGAYFYFNSDSASSAEAGDCIKVNKAEATDADVEKIDCNDSQAIYKVGKKLDGSAGNCPEGDYTKYTQTGGGSFTLCLILNAKEGDCFDQLDNEEQTTRVACGAAQLEILKVLENETDSEKCAEIDGADFGLAYSEPARAICGKLSQ